jgi:hypothetical protein
MQRSRYAYSFESTERIRERERYPVGSHPCARATNCAAATVAEVDGEQVRTPAFTAGPWCEKDRSKLWRSLMGIPELWVRLHGELGSKGQAQERIRMSRGAPLPLRADVDALLREHLFLLGCWDERVRTAAQLVQPDTQLQRARTDHGRQVAAFARTLAAHLGTLLALPPGPVSRTVSLHDLSRIPEGAYGHTHALAGYAEIIIDLGGSDGGEEILRLHHRTRALLGETRMRERLDVPCPDPACDLLMLERVQGSDYAAECGACGRLLSAAEYMTWVRLYANSLSGAEIAERTAAA